jgi:hypothetical protein
MTREEAADLLNVQVNASLDEVKKRYQDLFTDFQIRLTNAPTPNLKKTYQKNLQEFLDACTLMYPGLVLETQDLPSSQPSNFEIASPVSTIKKEKVGAASTRKHVPKAIQTEYTGFPISSFLILSAAILFAAMTAFVSLRWYRADVQEAKLEQTAQAQAKALAEYEQLFKKGLAPFKNGKFSVCNDSSKEMKINALTVAYIDREGNLKGFNSTYYNWLSWVIPPGRSQNFEYVKGMETVWDGSVLFYTMYVNYKGNDYFISEPWANVRESCKKFNFD